MRFARWTFAIAGIYGLIVMTPQYFVEVQIGRDYPPPITHPEYFYGFQGVGVAWQVAFLIMSRDPVRYRPLMLAAILEKLTFGIAVPILYLQHRTPAIVCAFSCVDLILASLFFAAYLKTGESTAKPA